MKINSDSLKEDVRKMMEEVTHLSSDMLPLERQAFETYVVAALEFGTSVIDHDKIETQADLTACTALVVMRVGASVELLIGHARVELH